MFREDETLTAPHRFCLAVFQRRAIRPSQIDTVLDDANSVNEVVG